MRTQQDNTYNAELRKIRATHNTKERSSKFLFGSYLVHLPVWVPNNTEITPASCFLYLFLNISSLEETIPPSA